MQNLFDLHGGSIKNNSIVTLVLNNEYNVISSKLTPIGLNKDDILKDIESLFKPDHNNTAVICFVTNDETKRGDDIKPLEYKGLAEWLNFKIDFVHVLDILYCRNNRWGSLICFDEFCCPDKGKDIW
jgi:hypothetical protein